jgi:hypothetical protein
MLRSVDNLIAPAVTETVDALDLAPEDAAAVRLAKQYAAAIDDAPMDERVKVLSDLGPRLLTALTELGATPKARAAAMKGGGTRAESRLAAIRAAR